MPVKTAEPLRERVLAAAADLITEQGWSAVTMAQIGKAAGVTRQSVYNEVGNKTDLAQALLAKELDDFLAVVDAEMAGAADKADGVQRAVAAVLEMAEVNALLRAVVSSAHGANSDLLPLLTIDALPIIEAASDSILARIEVDHPEELADPQEARTAVESIVRLVISHVTRPAKDRAQTAADIAWVASRLMQDADQQPGS